MDMIVTQGALKLRRMYASSDVVLVLRVKRLNILSVQLVGEGVLRRDPSFSGMCRTALYLAVVIAEQ